MSFVFTLHSDEPVRWDDTPWYVLAAGTRLRVVAARDSWVDVEVGSEGAEQTFPMSAGTVSTGVADKVHLLAVPPEVIAARFPAAWQGTDEIQSPVDLDHRKVRALRDRLRSEHSKALEAFMACTPLTPDALAAAREVARTAAAWVQAPAEPPLEALDPDAVREFAAAVIAEDVEDGVVLRVHEPHDPRPREVLPYEEPPSAGDDWILGSLEMQVAREAAFHDDSELLAAARALAVFAIPTVRHYVHRYEQDGPLYHQVIAAVGAEPGRAQVGLAAQLGVAERGRVEDLAYELAAAGHLQRRNIRSRVYLWPASHVIPEA